MSNPAKACAWHLAMAPAQLVPLHGTTIDEALIALEDGSISHGMCFDCGEAYRAKHGLTARRMP